jgi:cytochrome c-type biogenesis protein CcmH
VSTRRVPWWTLLAAVLVVALVIGSGLLSSAPPTAAQRAYAIETVVRCPSCEALTSAQSTDPTAAAVRAVVTQQIAQGRTDQQIKDYLVTRYGPSILLDPKPSGWSSLVWLLPLGGGVAAAGLLVALLVRRRNLSGEDPADAEGGRLLPPEVAEDRRSFLTQSLADADAEYLAGDLSDEDYLALRQRDLVRLAALQPRATEVGTVRVPASATGSVATDQRMGTQLDTDVAAEDAEVAGKPVGKRRSRSRRSRWLLGGAMAAFGAALIVFVFMSASARQPGESATGSFAQSQEQQTAESLAQAATLENQGQLGPAAQVYQSVLRQHASNEVALAQLGWLEYETGQSGNSVSLISDARAKLNRAVQINPSDYAARLYLGTVLLQQGAPPAAAVEQYRQFLVDSPPAATMKQAAPQIAAAFRKAGQPVPSQVVGG